MCCQAKTKIPTGCCGVREETLKQLQWPQQKELQAPKERKLVLQYWRPCPVKLKLQLTWLVDASQVPQGLLLKVLSSHTTRNKKRLQIILKVLHCKNRSSDDGGSDWELWRKYQHDEEESDEDSNSDSEEALTTVGAPATRPSTRLVDSINPSPEALEQLTKLVDDGN
mmetsp:Transcript_11772/g.18088  ORF Transcript_11772/g.18088 Transcript_11772/m.18088 type:complete len:168 (-) Transcript_11772:38-541(-)